MGFRPIEFIPVMASLDAGPDVEAMTLAVARMSSLTYTEFGPFGFFGEGWNKHHSKKAPCFSIRAL